MAWKPNLLRKKFTCKDLLAAGMINTGTELWPLILEHAWGMYLVDVSEQLAKRSSKLPCQFKKITDPTNEMPDIIDAEHGDFSIFSKFAENAYDSIALASITGKKAKIAPVDLSGGTKYDQWYQKF